jgi:F-type H+-transporting ATPase subunit O
MLTRGLRQFTGLSVARRSAVTTSVRTFSAKHEDLSLEGRYATALFQVSKEKKNLDKVFTDLEHLRSCMLESEEFTNFVKTPAIQQAEKAEALKSLGTKYGYDPITMNYIMVLLENKRLHELERMVKAFEAFYRAENNQIVCQVTSEKELSSSEKSSVVAALQARAGDSAKLMTTYDVNPSVMGGLMVKLGDQVFDFTVATKLEKLQTQLLKPIV